MPQTPGLSSAWSGQDARFRDPPGRMPWRPPVAVAGSGGWKSEAALAHPGVWSRLPCITVESADQTARNSSKFLNVLQNKKQCEGHDTSHAEVSKWSGRWAGGRAPEGDADRMQGVRFADEGQREVPRRGPRPAA